MSKKPSAVPATASRRVDPHHPAAIDFEIIGHRLVELFEPRRVWPSTALETR
ncbi:MAG: hypothetical protein OJF60_002226 [Burkholderiaceae bacterium]|nr:MAG: hypothetical protein OJF60_002226 [Burkholderiaceae bacterium]